jgi:hypothetical protein
MKKDPKSGKRTSIPEEVKVTFIKARQAALTLAEWDRGEEPASLKAKEKIREAQEGLENAEDKIMESKEKVIEAKEAYTSLLESYIPEGLRKVKK